MPACARLETSASAAPNGKFSERMTSPFSFRKALAFAEREDAWPHAPRLAEARRHRDAAGRFQESASRISMPAGFGETRCVRPGIFSFSEGKGLPKREG